MQRNNREHTTRCYKSTGVERPRLRSRKTVPKNLKERAVMNENEILRKN
jgi:hypothetical protein